ncbi:hypothetical protein ACP70R_013501 [Stipagrostis hirtigluma subsp. patula]
MMTTYASAPAAGAPPTTMSSGAAAPAAKPAHHAPPPRVAYTGVRRSPCGGWTAHVFDPDLRAVRAIGTFPDEHAAALAHDRVSLAYHGDGARLNFRPAFHGIEHQFLRRCRMRAADIDVCGIVADGTYEARYATFLRAVFGLEDWSDFMDVMLEFFLDRAAEIGEEALVAGGEKLAAKFVEMHRNKAVDPAWRGWYHRRVAQCMEKQRQQRAGGAMAVQNQCMDQQVSSNSDSSIVLSRE